MPVQVQQEQLEPCRVALTIEVPPEDVNRAMETVFNRFAKRTAVPGFRPGKAPRHLVKRYIDEGRVRDLAMEEVLTNAYRDALKQTGVEPYRYAEPQIDLGEEELDLQKGVTFKATLALEPKITLGNTEGLSAKRVVVKITDEDVETELTRIRERGATFEATEEPVAEGDRIRAALKITVGDEALVDASEEEPLILQVGANLAEFDQGILGLKAEEEKTFEFTYPEDYEDEEKRGQTASVSVKVFEVLRRTLPEVNDEFAQRLGLDTAEALRARLREILEAQAEAQADSEMEHDLVHELVRRSSVEFPDEMVTREASERLKRLVHNLEHQGATLEDYLESQKTDLAALENALQAQARDTLTESLVLIEFGHQNNVRVNLEDVEQEINLRAEAEGVKPAQMRRTLADNGELDNLQTQIFFRKVGQLLRSQAEIQETEA